VYNILTIKIQDIIWRRAAQQKRGQAIVEAY